MIAALMHNMHKLFPFRYTLLQLLAIAILRHSQSGHRHQRRWIFKVLIKALFSLLVFTLRGAGGARQDMAGVVVRCGLGSGCRRG
jgi:hypothetical protein